MPRRLLPAALVLGLVTAACATHAVSTADIGFGSGKQFAPLVADAQDNVGLFPSVAVTSDGQPYVAYLGFPQALAKGEVAVPRPIGAPSVPAAMLTTVHDGIWTRGGVAMAAEIQNVTVPFGPAIVPQVKTMKPENVNGTALAIDQSGGLHVAWVSDTGVWYAENMGGSSFMATQIEKATIKQRGPISEPSIVVDANGTAMVAYARTTAKGQEVVVASGSGSNWSTDVVGTLPLQAGGRRPSRVGIALLPDGTPVVAWATAVTVDAATKSNGGWNRTTIALGKNPSGIALAATPDGVAASFYLGDGVDVATSADGRTWDHANVASVGGAPSGQSIDGRSTGVGVDGSTTYVTWWDPGTNDVRLASGSGSTFKPIDLSGTTAHGDTPSLAVSDGGRVFVAWYDEVDQNLLLGTYGSVDGLSFAIQSPTPTGPVATPPATSTGGPGECTAARNGALTVTAQGLAFDTNCIEIPAGQKVTIHFDNKDAGTQHNIAVYPSSSEVTNPLFRGDPVTGPDSADYSVGPLKAGEYYFQCDFHPPEMHGTFKVVAGSGGPGQTGGGGAGGGSAVTTSITAHNFAFDTNEINLAAGQASTLTFTNQDAGTPHNVAIYKSASDLTTPLFRGDPVTGPGKGTYRISGLDPGTYYFQCDFHPTQMNGSVLVK
jgi:plastocyanin